MPGFFKKLFRKATGKPAFDDTEYDQHYEAKKAGLEELLGPMHDIVGHALIPYAVGGPVDRYYFCKAMPGTAVATMELIEPDGSGPKPNRIGTFELVAFTRHEYPSERSEERSDPFSSTEDRFGSLLTTIGRYSTMAVLNPGETCEVPMSEDESEPNACVVLDEFTRDGRGFHIDGKRHCLLLVMEVHRAEMEYAMQHGTDALLAKLKSAGHYPYSDLDRDSVV